MSSKDKFHDGSQGHDDHKPKPKGEDNVSRQKGAKSVSNKNKPKHKKDESDGSEENTTKKQQNSI